MFGKNEVRPLVAGDGSTLQVAEVFYSIQGEGPNYGRPAVFLRLSGCNLQCHFCDTVWDDKNDKYLTVKEIHEKIFNQGGNCGLVVITGGEPLRQPLEKLIACLVQNGYEVQIETNGTYWQPCLLDTHVTIVCSPKTAHVHPKIKEHCNDWKYVIRSSEASIVDGLPQASTQQVDPSKVLRENGVEQSMGVLIPILQKFGSPCRPPKRDGVTVWLSPCDEGPEHELLTKANHVAVAAECLKHGYRAQVQMHKILRLR